MIDRQMLSLIRIWEVKRRDKGVVKCDQLYLEKKNRIFYKKTGYSTKKQDSLR